MVLDFRLRCPILDFGHRFWVLGTPVRFWILDWNLRYAEFLRDACFYLLSKFLICSLRYKIYFRPFVNGCCEYSTLVLIQ